MSQHENTKPIDKMWGILSVDKKGNEGFVAMNTSIGPQLAVTGSEKVLEMYKNAARQGFHEARAAGVKIVVAQFARIKDADFDLQP
jgi:hypothetical protein